MSSILDWSDIEIALAVSEAGSISGAALALGKQQPTISARLNQLEGRLGVRLFERSRNGTKLTKIGEEIIQKAKIMNITALEIERTAHSNNKHEDGVVTFHCTDGLASYWVAPKLAEFISTHPKIKLELETGETPPSINSNQADLILQFDEVKEMDAVAVPLGWLHYVPLTTKEYLKHHGYPSDIYDALKFHHLKLRNAHHNREKWDNGISSMEKLLSYSLTTNNSSVYIEALKGGAGIAFLPSMFAKLYPELVYLDYGIVVSMQFWVTYNRNLGKVAKNKAVVTWLKFLFNQRDHPFFRQEFICPTDYSNISVHRPGTNVIASKSLYRKSMLSEK